VDEAVAARRTIEQQGYPNWGSRHDRVQAQRLYNPHPSRVDSAAFIFGAAHVAMDNNGNDPMDMSPAIGKASALVEGALPTSSDFTTRPSLSKSADPS